MTLKFSFLAEPILLISFFLFIKNHYVVAFNWFVPSWLGLKNIDRTELKGTKKYPVHQKICSEQSKQLTR